MTEAAATEKVEAGTEGAGTTTETTTAQTAGAAQAGTEQTTQEVTTTETEAQEAAQKSGPWGDDWRDKIIEGANAGKDSDDLRKVVNKYGSPAGLAKALLSAQREISTRGLQKPKPDDATDEKAMAEWRKSAGIPDKPEDYKLPDNVVKGLTDEDKPVLAQFTEFAHKKGMTADAVAGAAEWYTENKRAAEELRLEQDNADAEKCMDVLSDDWTRAELKGNRNLAVRYLEASPLGPEGWGLMRNQKGTLLANDPEFMKWASDQGRQMFGDAVFANTDVAQKHTSEMEEIQTLMKTDIRAYYAQKKDKRYAELLEIENRRKK